MLAGKGASQDTIGRGMLHSCAGRRALHCWNSLADWSRSSGRSVQVTGVRTTRALTCDLLVYVALSIQSQGNSCSTRSRAYDGWPPVQERELNAAQAHLLESSVSARGPTQPRKQIKPNTLINVNPVRR